MKTFIRLLSVFINKTTQKTKTENINFDIQAMAGNNGIVSMFLNKICKPRKQNTSINLAAAESISSVTGTSPSKEDKYQSWSKEQLIFKINELEVQNRTLALKNSVSSEGSIKGKKTKASKQDFSKPFDFSKFNTRFIALRFAYLGWNYNGLAVQKDPTPLPTVEGAILDVMLKCRLIPNLNTHEYNFSRCGRTDRGVSAMNQVISLQVRSNLTPEEQQNPENDSKEIDYIRVLNNRLPPDIRIHSVALRPPPGFDARFSCIYRHYKYIFKKTNGLDIDLMKQAAALYQGEDHDFRNFCKLDGSKQITNFKRSILSSQILSVDERENIYCFDLKGTAFLWHQVRNMMAILLLVGQGLEKPEIVTELMNIEKYPRKPIYDMANDIPLILYDCKFEQERDVEFNTAKKVPLEWKMGSDFTKHGRNLNNVFATRLDYEIKNEVSKIFSNFSKDQSMTIAMSPVNMSDITKICIDHGDGFFKNTGKYEPISKRQVQDHFESVNARYKEKKSNKKKN